MDFFLALKNRFLLVILGPILAQNVGLGPTSTLRVYRTTPFQSKPGEELFIKFMKEKLVTKTTYMLFEDHEHLLETFIDKTFVIRCFLRNPLSINLLSPGKLSIENCPLSTCRTIVNLEHFNDFGYIRAHLIKHKVGKVCGADVLVNRFNHVTSAQWFSKNKFEDSTYIHKEMKLYSYIVKYIY